ncbi:MAG: magnesium chelatase [Candidatus Wolframiiraptor sp. EX4484-121]|nr:MAG: magnesium chelatase [Candidatus Wolframiiraptor sp. EX4484-121]
MDDAIHALLIALLSEGHVLIEGPPGIAKTYLARAFSAALGLEFKRIQFTADILPSDIIGSQIYNRATGRFEFRKGPIFANIVLADEINRASPRSQSALLEAMQERQVTVEGVKYPLPRPFLIIATQNPIEFEGTYYLPEAEIDRFLIRIVIGYPNKETELEMLSKKLIHGENIDIDPVASPQEVLNAIEIASKVKVDHSIIEYIVRLAEATRRHEKIALGVSPRGEVALLYASRAEAAINGKDYVIPDHVKSVLKLVFNHRIILKGGSMNPLEAKDEVMRVLDEVLQEVPAPR